jgi:hypothetical protein
MSVLPRELSAVLRGRLACWNAFVALGATNQRYFEGKSKAQKLLTFHRCQVVSACRSAEEVGSQLASPGHC